MKIILSPAKKMAVDTDSLECNGLPKLINKTEILKNKLQSMSYEQLKKLWQCNDSIAEYNYNSLKSMDLYNNLTPAILSYDGIRFKYMAPSVFTYKEFGYLNDNLRILSGFYGVLRPFDGVVPYRLEMQARLAVNGCKNLYEFWGRDLYDFVTQDDDVVINLASFEYSKCVSVYADKNIRIINFIFADKVGEKIVEKGTKCKMARGEMTRFMAENNISNPEDLKYFDRQNYKYDSELSDKNNYVFIQHPENRLNKEKFDW